MDRTLARCFLESLLERVVVDPTTGMPHLPGVLSTHEVNALRVAVKALEGSPAPEPQSPAPEPQLPAPGGETHPDLEPAPVNVTPRPVHAGLVLHSIRSDVAEDSDVLLCLDFGTAASKAFAIEDGKSFKNLPLRLGVRGKQEPLIYPVPSSIWITDDGRIHFGKKAIALSEQNSSETRQRFDSPKQELTRGELLGAPEQTRLEGTINPTDVPLTKGDAITLYLAFLTDLACTELAESHGRSRYVRRRFALPSWPKQRRDWGERLLKGMLAHAQIVADTFHGRWDDGIPVGEAKRALDQIRALNKTPVHLIAEGVAEPLAAGAARLRRDEPARALAMVVDVGAGTSDFALFAVREWPDDDFFKAWPVQNCSEALSIAGDTLDKALWMAIMEQAGIHKGDPDYGHVSVGLRMRTRFLKEDLFTRGRCDYTLANEHRGTIELKAFLETQAVVNFGARLAETFDNVLQRAHRTFAEELHEGGLAVVLTGGGANLPMVRELAEGISTLHGFPLKRHAINSVPSAFAKDTELSVAYPQLAVAIGGASHSIINEGDALTQMPAGTTQKWVLGRYQVTGL